MREFLKGLELEKETIDTIMAEHGKLITESKEEVGTLKDKVKTYETEIKKLKDSSTESEDYKAKFEELDAKIKADEERANIEKEEKSLTDTIINTFGEKEFTSDYVKNGLISDIKTELAKAENKGKGISEIFETLTKDKEGIFVNPNTPPNMDGANPNMSTNVTKEAFTKMGYKERLALKQENPDLYQSFLNEK